MILKAYLYFSHSRAVIGVGVEEEDRKHTWLDDAESVSYHVTFTLYFTCNFGHATLHYLYISLSFVPVRGKQCL